MAESLALDGAIDALDMVLDAGAENLYNKYLTSKVKAHSARTCRAMLETMFNNIQMKRDDEPGGAIFAEMWEDDGEPAPAKRPEWMRHNLKVRYLPPKIPEVKQKPKGRRRRSTIKGLKVSPKRFAFTLSNAMAIERGDGIINIQESPTSIRSRGNTSRADNGHSSLSKLEKPDPSQSQVNLGSVRRSMNFDEPEDDHFQLKIKNFDRVEQKRSRKLNSNRRSTKSFHKSELNMMSQESRSKKSRSPMKNTAEDIYCNKPEKIKPLFEKQEPLENEAFLRDYIKKKIEA